MEPFLIPDPSYPEPTPLLPEVEAAVPYPLEALGEVLGGAAAAIVEAVQVPAALCGTIGPCGRCDGGTASR